MKGRINNDKKIGLGMDGLEVATFFAGILVVLGLLMESGPEAWKAIINRVWPHREVTGNALVTIGVFGEVAIGLFIARSAKRQEIESSTHIAELNLLIEQERHARAKIEEQLLLTIGPRKVTPEQRERIAFLAREFLPDVSFVIFVIVTLNVEDTKESTDFAWEMSDAFADGGKGIPVYTLQDPFAWEPNDIVVRLPSAAWSDIGSVVFHFLREHKFKVTSSVAAGLPPVLWHCTRNGGGTSVATPEIAKESIGIMIAKRSQPVFRLED